jgi:hypothetical protein
MMFFESTASDENVVEINSNLALSNEIGKDWVHKWLKGCRQVCQAKEHYFGLIQALVGDKGSLPFIAFPNTDIVIAPMNIKLSKDLCILELINNISSQRE